MTSSPTAALEAIDLAYAYGTRQALNGVTLSVLPGEIFGLVGPNGGGKTTLFRIASTLVRPQGGTMRILGEDVTKSPSSVRRHLGVVFQSPALDDRLTVEENLTHHARLYGLLPGRRRVAIDTALSRVKLNDRRTDKISTLSGGLKRRAEIAKVLLHSPPLLILDEPSTGLDPASRRDLWKDLERLRAEGTTVALTTHLMEEAAGCDRIAILNEGRIVALGTPRALVEAIGGEVIVVSTRDPAGLAGRISARFGLEAEVVDTRVRLERPRAHELVTQLVETFPGEIDAVTFGKPTLEDVFVHHTGREWRVS